MSQTEAHSIKASVCVCCQDPSRGHIQDGIIQDINRHAAVVVEGLPGDDIQQQTAEDVAQAVRLARQVGTCTKSQFDIVTRVMLE